MFPLFPEQMQGKETLIHSVHILQNTILLDVILGPPDHLLLAGEVETIRIWSAVVPGMSVCLSEYGVGDHACCTVPFTIIREF